MDLQKLIEALHNRFVSVTDGHIPDYIPEIANVDPSYFGIVIIDVNGNVYATGDSEQYFTLQSMSKPFTYGMALEDHGRETVMKRIGVEPTGQSFNSVVLDERTGRPYNPMVNAGAIAVANLIKGADSTTGLKRVLETLARYAGQKLFVDSPTFLSERKTGHRNRAIAHLMRNANMIDDGIDDTLDLYFQQCAVRVTAKDVAMMAATLANGGVNPKTNVRAIEQRYVRDLLSVMYTCGMYDSSGTWAYRVGLPSKSGVSGGIWAVVPRRMGIAVYSPRVDEFGHSVRAVHVFEALADELNLHVFCSMEG